VLGRAVAILEPVQDPKVLPRCNPVHRPAVTGLESPHGLLGLPSIDSIDAEGPLLSSRIPARDSDLKGFHRVKNNGSPLRFVNFNHNCPTGIKQAEQLEYETRTYERDKRFGVIRRK